MKLEVHIYDDRIEYRLSPFHKSSTIVFFDSINSIDIIDAKQLGVKGFKIKSSVRRIYYFGGGKRLRIKSKAEQDTYLGIWKYIEVEKLLKRSINGL